MKVAALINQNAFLPVLESVSFCSSSSYVNTAIIMHHAN
jgi:hypothetical protein